MIICVKLPNIMLLLARVLDVKIIIKMFAHIIAKLFLLEMSQRNMVDILLENFVIDAHLAK